MARLCNNLFCRLCQALPRTPACSGYACTRHGCSSKRAASAWPPLASTRSFDTWLGYPPRVQESLEENKGMQNGACVALARAPAFTHFVSLHLECSCFLICFGAGHWLGNWNGGRGYAWAHIGAYVGPCLWWVTLLIAHMLVAAIVDVAARPLECQLEPEGSN